MPYRPVVALLPLALIATLVTSASAETYRFVTPDGTVHLTNAPTDPRYQRLAAVSGTAAGWLRLPAGDRAGYAGEIRTAATRYGVPEQLVSAVIRVESGFNARAVSPKGARGLMQLMPETASTLGVRDTFDPRENIEGGVRHLRGLMDRFGNDLPLVLAAYNAGERAVMGYGGIPPYRETREYVTRVLRLFDEDAEESVNSKGKSGAGPNLPPSMYRTVADDGTVTYTNIPPRGRH